jgi:signal transduction histidine kinase/CheY-like chemotaxis protein
MSLATLLDIGSIPDVRLHERDRARQRVVVCLSVGAVFLVELWSAGADSFAHWIGLSLSVAYLAADLVYLRFDPALPSAKRALLYFFLAADPLFFIAVLALEPRTFAFLHPFVLVIIVRSGLRYGLRTMYFSWCAALASSSLLLATPFWRDEGPLLWSYIFMLVCVPVFFASLIRRTHRVREIEEERARIDALKDSVGARSTFLAKVSHELRSPLQGIVSALDVLAMRRGPMADADSELIGRIRRSSMLLNTHLRDMLTLAKGEAGRLEMRPEPFDACALVESVAASATDLASDRNLVLLVDVPPSSTFVVADGARIDQILTNLVVNSIRYTEVGQVRLAMAPFDPAVRRLVFTISDTGPGIPEAMLPTLLAPDRVITGSERRGEGSGIGLAIVRTLADHLGGHVEVKSELGKGTTFTVVIPAEPVEADEDDSRQDALIGRVLIVDDRDDVLDALSSVVDELGFESDRARSAAVAANLLASRAYDAALLDIEMPATGGAELAAETRRGRGPNAGTRLIGMSAVEPPDEVASRFDCCLIKPIAYGALRHALLGAGHGARPSQPGLWTESEP